MNDTYTLIILIALIVILIAVLIAAICVSRRGAERNLKKIKHYRRDVFFNGGIDIVTGKMVKEQKKFFSKTDGLTNDTIPIGYGSSKQIKSHVLCLVEKKTKKTLSAAFTDQLLIGRSNSYNLSSFIEINSDKSVSSSHCKVLESNGAFFIQDLGSRNHTYVNGKMISGYAKLENGDTLKIGSSSYVVQIT